MDRVRDKMIVRDRDENSILSMQSDMIVRQCHKYLFFALLYQIASKLFLVGPSLEMILVHIHTDEQLRVRIHGCS